MKFIDEVSIQVQSGHGGPGAVSFRREKFIEFGGPDGGNGGRGGDVVFVADENVATLLDLRMRRSYVAKDGEKGSGRTSSGADGQDIILRVPVGTILIDEESGERLADLDSHGAQSTAVKGGRGGKGNAFFTTSTNRAPMYCQPGEPGVSKQLRLELRLLADVGLLGMPNAGKSSLIAALSAAKPKVADYPFTTLVPNLGVVFVGNYQSFVMADVPGLIEGAHQGHGLGVRFLKHIERCRYLVHLVDISDPACEQSDPLERFRVINQELLAYSPEVAQRPMVVFLNKADSVLERSFILKTAQTLEKQGFTVFWGSTVTREGLDDLRDYLAGRLFSAERISRASL